MSEYLNFKRFITPEFIMVIYLLGALGVTLLSIALMLSGGIIYGVIMLIFGNLFWRVVCEYMVVQFRIYDEIVMLNRRMGGGPMPTVAPAAPAQPAAPATPTCPTCGSPLRYIQQYQRWYCDREQKYV
jgi:hypothetical protein